MLVQLAILFLAFTIAFFFRYSRPYKIYPDEYRKAYIMLFMLILILQSGLRNYGVGADTYTYKEMFEDDIALPWKQIIQNFYNVYADNIGKDAGYAFFEKIFSIFSTNYRVYLFFVAFFFFLSLGIFLYKNTNLLIQVVFALVLYQALFYNFFSVTGIRQTLATSITLFCFEFIKSRKIVPFFILILIASILHKSVLAFLPFYFVGNIKNSGLIYSIAIIVFPLVVLIRNSFAFFIALASSTEHYLIYVMSSENQTGTPVFTALIFLVMIFGWIFLKKTMKNYPDSYRYYNAMALAFIFTPLTWVDSNLMRIVQYFSIFMILFIPKVIDSISEKKSIRNVVYISMMVILMLLIVKVNAEYKFLWEYMSFSSY